MVRKNLLLCGILSPLLYAVSDGLTGSLWKDYSFRDQTISELGAIGAPSRPLFSLLLMFVYLLLTAFGVGVWRSGRGKSALRVAGGLIVVLGMMALTAGQFVPMQRRGIEQGLMGMLHLIEGGAAVLMIVMAIGYAAASLGRNFRWYSIYTIVVMLAFGVWSGTYAPLVAAGLPTPWLGVIERIFWYTYQLWFAVLAFMLLRQQAQDKQP